MKGILFAGVCVVGPKECEEEDERVKPGMPQRGLFPFPKG